jgi:hypothetical protein
MAGAGGNAGSEEGSDMVGGGAVGVDGTGDGKAVEGFGAGQTQAIGFRKPDAVILGSSSAFASCTLFAISRPFRSAG